MSRFSCSEITTARLSYTVPEGFPQQVTRIFVMAAIPTNGLSDNFSAKQMPTSRTRDQSHVTACCAIVRGVWRGMVDLSTSALRHPCHQPHQPASVLALLEDATRLARHVCHAPTLSAAQHAQQRRLGSGASAAVMLHFDGPEVCPGAPCIHAERHGMRSSFAPRALSETASLDPQRPPIPSVCSFNCFKYNSLPSM